MRGLAAAALVGWIAGCGGATASSAMLVEAFGSEEAQLARRRAPDLFAPAERARRAAERAEEAGDGDAAADHATRARLLLASAIAESDRIGYEEARLAAERREQRAFEAARRDEQERAAIAEELRLAESARVAREEARVALEVAARDEARRRGAGTPEQIQAWRSAAAALRQRARLVILAAEAMDVPPARVSELREALDAAGRQSDPATALGAADRVLLDARAALGQARAGAPRPTADELGTLAETAREQGFEVQQLDSGLALTFRGAVAGTPARPALTPRGRAMVDRLAALIVAHPHGRIRLDVYTAAGTPERAAAAQARVLIEALARAGVASGRVLAEPVRPALPTEPADPRVDAVFLAYAATP